MAACSVVSSQHTNPQLAAAELASGLDLSKLSGVLFFCSASYDLPALAAALVESFPNTLVAGCTTAGEISLEGYSTGSIVAVAFDQDFFHLQAELISPIDTLTLDSAEAVVSRLVAPNASNRINGQHFALTLFDGLASQEELVLAVLDKVLLGIPHFGGSAGDDINLATTHVYLKGAFHNRAAVVIMFETSLPFEVFTTHHMQPLASKLVVTEADPITRRVYELNAQPAADAYAQLIKRPLHQLSPEVFALQPLAVKFGQNYYVRSIRRVNSDKSLEFYCAVGKGSVLTLMQPAERLSNLDACLSDIAVRIGQPLLTLGCDCFLRRLEALQRGEEQLTSEFLRRHKVVGFNTYGEHYAGLHINQTFTGVALGCAKAATSERA